LRSSTDNAFIMRSTRDEDFGRDVVAAFFLAMAVAFAAAFFSFFFSAVAAFFAAIFARLRAIAAAFRGPCF
jgi:hypothetical protein